MFKSKSRIFNSQRHSMQSCKLRFECHEDKRMLSAMADIVFLVDESQSDSGVQNWVKDELVSQLEDGNFLQSRLRRSPHWQCTRILNLLQ